MEKQKKQTIKSEFFTLEELTKSGTATRLGIKNQPGATEIRNLQYGVNMVLDPLRRLYKNPIIINSGYRCQELNKAVGGVANSWHIQGNAVDIHLKDEAEAKTLFNLLKTIPSVDTVLYEHSKSSTWLHVQWNMNKTPRHHFNYNYKA